MKSQRWLLATLVTAAVCLGFVVGKSENVAVAQGNAPKANGRIGKYQIAAYTTGGPASSAYCLMVDTETGELWSWGPGGNQQVWEKILPELRLQPGAAAK